MTGSFQGTAVLVETLRQPIHWVIVATSYLCTCGPERQWSNSGDLSDL